MRVAVLIGIVSFLFLDTFFMWCLLRANALYERREDRYWISEDDRGKRTETSDEKL